MERNLIAPRVDVVFRVLFGRERNKDMLVDLLTRSKYNVEIIRIFITQIAKHRGHARRQIGEMGEISEGGRNDES